MTPKGFRVSLYMSQGETKLYNAFMISFAGHKPPADRIETRHHLCSFLQTCFCGFCCHHTLVCPKFLSVCPERLNLFHHRFRWTDSFPYRNTSIIYILNMTNRTCAHLIRSTALFTKSSCTYEFTWYVSTTNFDERRYIKSLIYCGSLIPFLSVW